MLRPSLPHARSFVCHNELRNRVPIIGKLRGAPVVSSTQFDGLSYVLLEGQQQAPRSAQRAEVVAACGR